MSSYTDQRDAERIDALSKLSDVTFDEPTGRRRLRRLFPVLLLTVFFTAMLTALITGVFVYRHVSDVQQENVARREGLDLIANIVRANDATGAVAAGDGPEGRSLVIVESLDSGTYETRLYLYEGKIVQEYSLQGASYTPAKANTVTESETFSFTYSDGVLSITTDQGTREVALHYLQGGE